MRRGEGVWVLALVSAAFLACWAATPALGANKIDKELAGKLGRDVVAAAHPSAKDISLLDYQESTKDGRLVLHVKMKYYGKLTTAKYTADVTITIDPTASPPRVVDVAYKDDNKIPANTKNLKNVGDEIAKRLPKKP